VTADFADFLAALNSEGVDDVVIGGIAVLLIEPSLENAIRRERG
jgi:hypothetical protein